MSKSDKEPLITNKTADARADLPLSTTRQWCCAYPYRPRVTARCTSVCLALDVVVGTGALCAPFICGELGLLFGAALITLAAALLAITSLWILEACARAEGMLRDTEDALGPLLEGLLGPVAVDDGKVPIHAYDISTDDMHGSHNRHVPTGAMEGTDACNDASPRQSQNRSQARDARRQGAGRMKGAGLLNNQLSAGRVSCFDLSTMCALFGVGGSHGHQLVAILLCTLVSVLLAAAADVAAASASATICTTPVYGASNSSSTNSSEGGHGNVSFSLMAPTIHAECLRSARPASFGLFAIIVLLLTAPQKLRQRPRHQQQQRGVGRCSVSSLAPMLMRGLTAVRMLLLLLLLIVGVCLLPRGAARSAARVRALLGPPAAASIAEASPPPLWQWGAAGTTATAVSSALVLAGSSAVIIAPALAAAALVGASASSRDRSHAVSPSLRAQRSHAAALHQRRAVLEPLGTALVCGVAVTVILGVLYASAYGGHRSDAGSEASRTRSNVLPLLSDSLLQLRPPPLRCAVTVLPFLGSVALAPPLVMELATAAGSLSSLFAACDGRGRRNGLVLALQAGRRAAGGHRESGKSVQSLLATVLAALAPIALAALLSEPGAGSWPAHAGAVDVLRGRASTASGSLGVARLWRCAASAAALVSLTVPAALQLQSVRTSRSAAVASKFRAMVTADMDMDVDVDDGYNAGAGVAAGGEGEGTTPAEATAAGARVAQLVRLTVQAAAAARKAVPLSALVTTAARVRPGRPVRGHMPTLDRATTPVSGWYSHPLLAFALGGLGLVLSVWFACGTATDWALPGAGTGGWLGWAWMMMTG